eukprot:2818670-Karenia_brevis.AAC.1
MEHQRQMQENMQKLMEQMMVNQRIQQESFLSAASQMFSKFGKPGNEGGGSSSSAAGSHEVHHEHHDNKQIINNYNTIQNEKEKMPEFLVKKLDKVKT